MPDPSISRHDVLTRRLRALLAHLGVEGQADEICALLWESHGATGRRCHDLAHLDFCLTRLDDVRGELRDPVSAELALWFQDVVDDPGADDNQLRSALLFDVRLGVHLPTRTADAVHAGIMATAHDGDPGNHDARLVADIDLSRLALPWPEFSAAAGWLQGNSTGPAGRGTVAFFATLLARPSIYLTEYFSGRCEQQARRNIEALLVDIPPA